MYSITGLHISHSGIIIIFLISRSGGSVSNSVIRQSVSGSGSSTSSSSGSEASGPRAGLRVSTGSRTEEMSQAGGDEAGGRRGDRLLQREDGRGGNTEKERKKHQLSPPASY